MRICLSHASALEYYRALPEHFVLDRHFARSDRLETCAASCGESMARELERLGILARPIHVLCSRSRRQRSKADVVCHTCTAKLPGSSLVTASSDVMACAPPLLFTQASARLNEIDAALLAFELCSMYSLASDGFKSREHPLSSCEKMGRFISLAGRIKGVKTARSALSYVLDRSASPMETAMALLLAAPPRLGGMGLGGAVLNSEIATADGVRFVDLFWPEYSLGLEYQSETEHRGWVKRELDDRRRNAILATGVEVMSVYYRDLSVPSLFDKLVDSIASIMKKRVRIRMRDFKYRQTLLRARVLPPVRWGS